MTRGIQCKYSCFKCGVYRRTVTVPVRGEEDVITWLNEICAPVMIKNHAERSPGCLIKSFSEVMIPVMDGTERVGELPPDRNGGGG